MVDDTRFGLRFRDVEIPLEILPVAHRVPETPLHAAVDPDGLPFAAPVGQLQVVELAVFPQRNKAGQLRPQGILACIAGVAAAQGMGLSVPEDISCFGFDGIRLASVMTPSIATYRQNAQGIGQQAAEELIAAIEDPKCYVPRVITVPGTIQPGGSVRDLTVSELSEKE